MPPEDTSDTVSDPEALPRPSPSPIESLPLELLGRITHLALDPSDDTKHSPKNTTFLRSLALVSRAWYLSAVRELVVSPRFTSPSQLGVFVNLIERLDVGNRVKEIQIAREAIPARKRPGGDAVLDYGLVISDSDSDDSDDDQLYAALSRAAGRPVIGRFRDVAEVGYDAQLERVVDLCGRVATLRIGGMQQPGFLLQKVDQMPIEAIWLNRCRLPSHSLDHLPPTLRALHLSDLQVKAMTLQRPLPPSLLHIAFHRVSLGAFHLTTPTGTVLDTIQSILLHTHNTEALKWEIFPKVVHLELVEDDSNDSYLGRAVALLNARHLPKLERMTLPDSERWRESWRKSLHTDTDGSMAKMKVVWKPVA